MLTQQRCYKDIGTKLEVLEANRPNALLVNTQNF